MPDSSKDIALAQVSTGKAQTCEWPRLQVGGEFLGHHFPNHELAAAAVTIAVLVSMWRTGAAQVLLHAVGW